MTQNGSSTSSLTSAARRRLVHKTTGAQRFAPVLLQPGINFVGRVPGNHLVLESPLVSRRHAKLIVTDLGVTLHDLDSHNGVFVNGKKVRTGPILPGDLVYFADVCCALERDEEGTGEVVAAAVLDAEQAPVQASGLPEAARALLLDVTDRLLHATDGAFLPACLHTCREHLGADVALFTAAPLGERPPVVEGPGTRAELLGAVRWPLIQGALASREVHFADPESARRLHGTEGVPIATIAVPVARAGALLGALYFSGRSEGRAFGAEDAEALGLVAEILGLRLAAEQVADSRPAEGSEEVTVTTLDHPGDGERELRAALDRAQNAIDEHQRESLEARKQVSTLRSEILGLRNELAEERTRLDPLRQAIELGRQSQEALQQQLLAAGNSAAALQQEIVELRRTLEESERVREEQAASMMREPATDALRASHLIETARGWLPPRWADGLEAQLHGIPSSPLGRVERLILCVSLHGFDAWCESQTASAADERLAAFCSATHRLVEAYGGEVEQVLGHTHLAGFAPGPGGALAAARCAAGLARALGQDLAVQAGLDVGTLIGGFSHRGTKVSYVAAGKSVAVARGAMEAAPPGGVMASDAIRDLLPQGAGVLLVNHGPHIVRGIQLPMVLHAVQVDVT